MRRPVAVTLALLLALAGAAPAGAAAAAHLPATNSVETPAVPGETRPTTAAISAPLPPADLGGGFAQTGDVEADRVILRATLRPNGTAVWRIAYRIELTDDNTTAAFESLQADIENNSTAYVERFESRMTGTVAAAENATGREMAARNFSVTADRSPFPASTDYGVVAYEFTWEGFAATPGNRLVAGDALAGLYLDSGTVLTVAWPEEYAVRSASPTADERSETSLTWRGERNFGPDQPRVTLAPASPLPIRPAYLAAAAAVLLGIGGAFVLRRRGVLPPGGQVTDVLEGDEGAATGSSGSEAAVGTAESDPGGGESPADDGTHEGAAGRADTDDGDADDADSVDADSEGTDTGTATPPEELLSPHERVTRLVEANGGRMKQADVTEELGWSAARTSQVVGDLRDDGTIESFRLGRENVLRLPEADDEPHPGDTSARDDE